VVASLTMLVVQAGRQRQQPVSMIERFAIHFALGRRLREPPGRPRAGPRRGCLLRRTDGQPSSHFSESCSSWLPGNLDEFLGLGDPSDASERSRSSGLRNGLSVD
jgi:hypothetical protein